MRRVFEPWDDKAGRRSLPGGRAAFGALLLALALGAGVVCARAALGRTGSWSFPIDDAYIYGNYVLSAGEGRLLQYNPGEHSGGVTGPGWFVLLWGGYRLTAPLAGEAAAWAPAAVQTGDPALAAVAGRLYLAAYLLGGGLLALAAAGTARLAEACYRPLAGAAPVAGLAGLALLLDRPAIWGAFSGLELPLALALAAWAPALLLRDVATASGPRLRGSLALAALLPWARPELAIIAGAGGAWLAWAAARRAGGVRARHVAQYAAAAGGGLLALALLYLGLTGRPLPSSFYAKVGGPRLGERMLAPLAEWVAAGRLAPFLLLVAAALGGLLLALALWRRRRHAAPPGRRAAPALPPAWALVAVAAGGFLAAMLLTLPWFGQEDRYIVPLHPLLLVLAGGGVVTAVAWGRRQVPLPVMRRAGPVAAAVLVLALGLHLLELRVWAAGTYALYVQNIEDAHVAPARWLAANTPPGTVIASEPIGALRLFSGRPTVDIVGLTTPALLGTYGDWAATEAALRARDARYLLFYPRWWPAGQPLPWATEVRRFPVPDNRIAGDDPIAVYRLEWR
jgi:hypothetical protein